ncbi:MAG: hypothetical protein QOD99_1606, partial [Chthoniobacter sp.]|nr:hypothetical protein [Chthoniobacter sp.]
LSDTMTEGTLVKWHKKPGDTVVIGDVLAEVETDKATMEMEAFDEGTLGEVYVPEGGKAGIGEKLAELLAPGEKAGQPVEKNAPGKKGKPAKAESKPATEANIAQPKTAAAATSGNGRVKASPLARKIAAEKGVDLSGVTGTGPGGRILQRDLVGSKSAPAKASQPTPAGTVPLVPATKAGEGDRRIPLSGMRKTIAERLLASKTQIPHFYLNIEVDVSELMRMRGEINVAAEKSGQPKLTVNDFVLKAVVLAATKVPKVNAAWDQDAVIEYANVNLAVAVAIEDGLVTPVIRGAQTKSLRQISEAVKDLAGRARGKKLKPDEYQGGTLTVSNLGSYGVESFSAIINPPQSLILSIGAIVKKPVVNARNEIVVGQRMSIGMSCDHRVVDGAIGAEYLAELRRLIENPTLMLI